MSIRRPAATPIPALLCLLAVGGPAAAFHDGGVAHCNGCHVMHGEQDGQVTLDGARPLLRAPTATDVCLMCHGGQDGVFGDNPLSPPPERGAGNFVFLLEENLNDGPDGLTAPIGGEAAGHSIVSLDRGTGPETRWTSAPGGTFPSDQLGCTSCHDPHGNGRFRMLNGTGPVQGGIHQFTAGAPAAAGLDIRDPLAVEAVDQHTAYHQGMSDWCGNCHDRYHQQWSGGFEHPGDRGLGSEVVQSYNSYLGTGQPAVGLWTTAYLPEVPFESTRTSVTGSEGPQFGARLMCLTCHRAHASSAPAAGRWDFNVQRLADDGAVSGSWPLPSPFPDPAQGQLCAKCHAGGIPD